MLTSSCSYGIQTGAIEGHVSGASGISIEQGASSPESPIPAIPNVNVTIKNSTSLQATHPPQPTGEEGRNVVMAPANWHKVEAGAFSLFAPLGWESHQLQGVDSYVGEFVGDGVVLRFDFGRYSSGYLKKAKKPAYVIGHESIGGFPAKIASPRTPGRGITGVYFHNVGRSNGLCLWSLGPRPHIHATRIGAEDI
jgi:hypothetical protein